MTVVVENRIFTIQINQKTPRQLCCHPSRGESYSINYLTYFLITMLNSTLSNLPKLIIYWCRRDFRLTDNPALFQAVAKAKETNTDFLPMFILDDGILKTPSSSFVDSKKQGQNQVNIGYPRRLFLSKVLSNFAFQFPQFYVLKGDYKQVFETISQHYDTEVFVNEDIEPYSISRDEQVSKLVNKFHSYSDQISVDKSILSGTGNF